MLYNIPRYDVNDPGLIVKYMYVCNNKYIIIYTSERNLAKEIESENYMFNGP